MIMKKTPRRITQKTQHIVTMAVKNGPFSTKALANQACSLLNERGVRTSEVTKNAKGCVFTSKLSYSAPSVIIRDRVVKKLHEHASKAGLPKSAISITLKKV
jgi:hypothetical protein